MSHPQIPVRTSSKRALEQSIESDTKEKRDIEQAIQRRRKKIKAKGSFDAQYWAGHKEVVELELQRHELVRKISVSQFIREGGEKNKWRDEEKAMILKEEENTLEIKNRVLEEHITRMSFPDTDGARKHRKWIMEMITSMPITQGGLGMAGTVGQGPRDSSDQSSFRSKILVVYNSKHPDDAYDEYWCPITSCWVHEDSIRAAHIFPYGAGQTAMDELFGRDATDRQELFEPQNSIMMSKDAEKRIANGCIVIVPDVPDDATTAVLDEWTRAEIKDYKLRVLRPNDPSMQKVLPANIASKDTGKNRRLWHELDGEKVNFLTDFRPRARYLYWQFAVSLLRKAWQSQHREDNPLIKEFGKRFWGTRGSWIKKKHLLGFKDYLGHALDWENLMEAAIEPENEDDSKPDAGGVIVACEQLREVRRKSAKRWKDDEEDYEDNEEEEENEEDEDEYKE